MFQCMKRFATETLSNAISVVELESAAWCFSTDNVAFTYLEAQEIYLPPKEVELLSVSELLDGEKIQQRTTQVYFKEITVK